MLALIFSILCLIKIASLIRLTNLHCQLQTIKIYICLILIRKFEREIESFSKIVQLQLQECKEKSTKQFWLEKKKSPFWFALQNICGSSSFIERFFSVTGAVCDQKSSKMDDELISCRCMLKASCQIYMDLNKANQ